MPYVNVPNDLSKIKTKIAFNLTRRQLICFGGAAAVGIPVYLLTRHALGGTGAMFLMIALMLPAFSWRCMSVMACPLKGGPEYHPGQVPAARCEALSDAEYLRPVCGKGGHT